MARLLNRHDVATIVIPIESSASLLTRAGEVQMHVRGELVLAPRESEDESGGEEVMDLVRFGLNSVPDSLESSSAGFRFSALDAQGSSMTTRRRSDGGVQFAGTFIAEVFYPQIEEETDLEFLADDVASSPYERFRCSWSGLLTTNGRDVLIFQGELRLVLIEGKVGALSTITTSLTEVRLLPTHATCDLITTNRILEIDPIGFSRLGSGPHTGTSLASKRPAADRLWRKCCVQLHLRPLRVITDPGRFAETDPSRIPRWNDFQGAVRVYFMDAMTGHGGGFTQQHGMVEARIMIADQDANPNLLAHEIGHALGGDHPHGHGSILWPGDPGTILEPSGAVGKPNPSRNTLSNCCQVRNSGLVTGHRCRMTPDP